MVLSCKLEFQYSISYSFIGKIYLVGGLVQSDSNTQESCDGRVEIFHPVPSKWDFAPSLKEPRYNHEAVTLSKFFYFLKAGKTFL